MYEIKIKRREARQNKKEKKNNREKYDKRLRSVNDNDREV